MHLDGLAKCNTPRNHNLIVSHVQNQKILLVSQSLRYGKSTLFTYLTISQMQIGQSFVVLDSTGEDHGTLWTNLVLIKQQFRQESFVLKRLSECRYGLFGQHSIGQGNYTQCVDLIKSIGNLDKALIPNRIVVQIQLAQFVFVREHLTQGICTFPGYLIALQMQ